MYTAVRCAQTTAELSGKYVTPALDIQLIAEPTDLHELIPHAC